MTKKSYFLVLFILSSSSAHLIAQEKQLNTVKVSYQQVASEFTVNGVVEAVKQATMGAQTSGQVLEVNFDVDDFVEKEQVLVRLKSVQQQASLGQTEAQLGEAEAGLKVAEKSYDRIKQLYAKHAISAAQMDQVQADLEMAQAKIESIKAVKSQAKEQVEYTVIRAPYSGVVLERHIEPGEIATQGQPIMTGFSLDNLRVLTTVPQSYIASIRHYKNASIALEDGEKKYQFDSQQITISPYADAKTHTFKVRIGLPPAIKHVYPGMFAKIAFTIGQEKRLMIPESVVAYRGEVRAVYTVDKEGKIYMRHVRLGDPYLGMVEVLAGLEQNEQVVLNPVKATITLKQQRKQVTASEESSH
jgi:RND family efflux transporter MFP subunit